MLYKHTLFKQINNWFTEIFIGIFANIHFLFCISDAAIFLIIFS